MSRAWRRLASAGAAMLALAAVVVGAGVLAVLLLGRLPDDDERALLLPALLAAVVATLAYEPTRRALAEATRSRRGVVRTPEDVIATFGERASRGVAIDELLLQLAEALRRSLRLRRAEVWVMDATVLGRVASVPEAGGAEIELTPQEIDALGRVGTAGEHWLSLWAPELGAGRDAGEVRIAPARHGGQLLGLILVDRGEGAERLTDTDDRALGELGRRLGDVLRTRQLDAALRTTLGDLRRTNEELRASRARLVQAADQERRRLERDLHDGAQQHLVALAVNLGMARDMVTDDPQGAAEVLDALAADTRETVQQLRDLAHGIYPPLLRDGGLAPALVAAGRRALVTTRVQVEVRERFAPQIEAALYFCCLEALQNAAKHAPAATVQVTLRRGDATLVLEIADDGPGFDPATTPAGQGLQNMADRLGAVGGSVSIDARPGGGVHVVATVPVEAP